MPEPSWTPLPKPWPEMSQQERDDHAWEIEADLVIDEAPFVPLLELARGLVEDTREHGDAASLKIAEVLRRRASGLRKPTASTTAPPSGSPATRVRAPFKRAAEEKPIPPRLL